MDSFEFPEDDVFEGLILSDTPVGEKKTPLELAVEKLEVLEGNQLSDSDNLTELEKEKAILQEQLAEIFKKMGKIKEDRYTRRRILSEARRDVDVERLNEVEAKREAELNKERLDTYENLKAYAKELNAAWYPFAMKHQWEAAMQVALSGSTLLADAMGLGKTMTSIMAADLLKAKKILVVAPADVTLNFFDEFRMWAPHRNAIPMKSATPQVKKFITPIIQNSPEFTLVMNYETLWGRGADNQRFIQSLKDAEFDMIFIDEAHNAKNTKGQTFQVMTDIAKTTKHVVPISGTFILNSPADIWPNLNLIDPNTFYDKRVFLETFCMQDLYDGKWKFKTGGAASLIKRLGSRVIRRTLKDTDIILPTQTVNEVLIPYTALSVGQQTIIEQLEQYSELLLSDGKKMSVAAQIALITRNRQAAVWPGGIKIVEFDYDDMGEKIKGSESTVFDVSEETTDSIKLDYAVDMLERKFKLGQRSVVFSQFKTAIVELTARLEAKGMRVARFDGDTKDPMRQAIKKDFLRPSNGVKKENFEYDVVIANFKTGGVGLTFTEATYMLLLDEEWNPGKNDQAYARICRIGQTEETQVDILRLDKSVDMWMKSLNEIKRAISDGFEGEIANTQDSLIEFLQTRTVAIAPVVSTDELEEEMV